jgi:ATP-dependent Clp protease ATP-binding subunit ClpA
VILFDEIEKAHPSIYNLLLPALDDGLIYDKLGNAVSFRNAYIVFTSNAGFKQLLKGTDHDRDSLEAILADYFSAEFLDRLEHIVYFQPLNLKARQSITIAKLEEVKQRIAIEYNLKLVWDSQVVDSIAAVQNNSCGARDILRWMTDHVKPSVSRCLIELETTIAEPLEIKLSVTKGIVSAKPVFKNLGVKLLRSKG